MKQVYHKYIAGGLVAFGAGTLGFILGFLYSMNLLVNNMVILLQNSGVDLHVSAQQIADLIQRYIGWMG